jgi:hypothetical protein
MDIYRPLRWVVFLYELFRLGLLVGFFAVLAPREEAGAVFPYVVYVTANGLYPLMALFIWRDLEQYRNYLPLYGAGKILGVFCFYLWGFFMVQSFFGGSGAENSLFMDPLRQSRGLLRLGGSLLISLGDLFSVLGCWILYSKLRRAAIPAAGEV